MVVILMMGWNDPLSPSDSEFPEHRLLKFVSINLFNEYFEVYYMLTNAVDAILITVNKADQISDLV